MFTYAASGTIEATERFPGGGGHLITWNGPMMGHLNSFSASGGRKAEGIQEPFILSLACKSVVLNHVYIHSFRSIIKATEKFPGGGGI